MGIITVDGPQTGTPYAVRIAGEQPTPEEQERINKYVADQEQYTQSVIAGYRGAPTVQQQAPAAMPDPEPEDTTAVGRGLRRIGQSSKSLLGTSIEELGEATGIASLEQFGRRVEESGQAGLERLIREEGITTRQDVEDFGTGASYVGELIGEELPLTAAGIAGSYAGSKAGAALGTFIAPGIGTAIGAGLGGIAGGGAALLPLIFGSHMQRQEEAYAAGELENVDAGRALRTAIGASAVDGIANTILRALPFRPGVGNLFSRTVKTGAAGVATEVPTEITQQIIERAQAGLPIDSDDAIQEYIDAGVAAGILGGGIGVGAGAIRPDLAKQELDQDFDEFMQTNAGRLANVDQHIDQDERNTDEILALPAPDPAPVLDALPAPQPETIFEGKDFGRNEYNTVLQQVQEDGELNMPKAQSRLREMTGSPVPMQRVRSIAELLAERGEIAKRTRAKKDKYTVAPAGKAASDAIDALRRDTDTVMRKIKKISAELPRLDLDRRYAEQTGRDTYGKRRKAAEVERVIQSKLVQLDKLNERLEGNKQRLRTVNVDYSVPVTEKVGVPASQVRMQDFIEQNRREQEAELQKVRAAADARAVADAVRANRDKNISVTTREYTQRQGQILDNLRKRLDKIGLKNVKLEGKKVIGSEQEGFAEGVSYTSPDGEQVIGLSMGLYDPALSDADYEARVADVMNHEIIHALRNLNVFTPKELKLLSRAARKTKYVKAVDGKKIKRNYSYFDRAARINPELSAKKDKQGVLSALEEEAVAEMYRDYVSGNLPKVGQSRSILKRIGDFFKSIVGAHVDDGFNSVDSIFGNITGGSVAGREQVTRQAQEALDMTPQESVVKASRVPVTEEEFRLPQDIRMPVDPALPPDQVRSKIQRMTNQNRPIVRRLVTGIDAEFGTKSGDNAKDLSKVTQKARRPSILAEKPWHNVSHIRDSYRFKTVIDDFRDVPGIFNKLLDAGISLVKIDTNKLFEPKEWGWRIIAFDLRMPNGQLVEWYLPLRELEIEKKQRGHLIFEEWRNKTQEELYDQRNEYLDALERSYRGYDNAFKAALERVGLTPQEAEASWRSAESSISEAARNARKSSGVGISSGVSSDTDLTVPSAVRTALEPSSMKMIAREVPSSTSANASSDIGVTPSDIDVSGMPLEQQPSFARLRRSDAIPTLANYIRNNPDGFTISPDTYEPVSGGFSVAPLKEAEIITGDNLPEEVLVDYLKDNKDIGRAIGQPVYLGGWFDSESNQYFLDNSLVVPTLEEALYIADAAEQLAIFDLNKREEIRTDAGIRGLQESGAYSSDAAVGYKGRLAETGRRFAEARNNRNAREKEQLVGRTAPAGTQAGEQRKRQTGDGKRRYTAGTLAPLEGAPNVRGASGPDENLVAVAEQYAQDNGIDLKRQSEFVVVDEGRATRIAKAYEDMKHDPQNPVVKEAYQNLINQTKAQYDALVDAGYEFTFFDGNTDPYDGNPWNAMRDLRANKRMAVYGTYDGYGTEGITQGELDDNPMLQDTGLVWRDQNGVGRPVTANDLFRAVHDAFGHGLEGAGFRARGEENAWQAHVRLFTGSAVPAITSETRGQNSWLNYGPYGEANRNAKVEDTVFADQKTGLMPEFTWQEGVAGDADALVEDEAAPLVKEGATPKKLSRLTVPLTQEQRDASILDYIDPSTGKPLFKAKPNSIKLVAFANKILGLRGSRSYDIINSEEDRQEVANIFAAEAEAALLSSSDALGWYDKTLKLAKQVLSKVYPEVTPTLKNGERNPSYDADAEVALDFATAITSNGLAVTDNYDFAARQYDAWKASEDGKFPVEGKGAQGGSMLGAFGFWNDLVDLGLTPPQINELLMTEARRGDLNRMMADILGLEKIGDLPKQFKANSDELANEIVSFAYLLGPKIGNGFYRNLRGNFSPITMDRWWMRFMNRITGNPIKEVNPATLEKNVNSIWTKIRDNDLTDMDREILATARKRMTSGRLRKSDIVDISPIVNEIFEEDYYARAYNKKLDELKAQGYEVTGKEGENARKIAQAARPNRTPFLQNIGTYVKNVETQLQEAPRSGSDRKAMRDVTDRARQILKVATGIDINNADIQALMWYAEKRLYAAGGVRKGRGDDNDYADGAIYVLKKKGLNNADIQDTLPDSERKRVVRIASELAANEKADADVVQIGGPEYGDFFGPRRLVIEERAISENLTPAEQAEAAETLSAIDELGTRPPVKFSAIPTRPYAPVRAPVQGGGLLDYAYGFIKDGRRKIPVILPEGSHKEIGNVEVGHGLYHIHRRAHDRELVENSNYKRVEKAIYDLMRRWQDQGYDDGESVIGYPSRDGYVLEWRNNLTHSAPPLQLVLEEKPLGNSTVFYVKTFYPILEKNKRINDPHRGKKRAQRVRAYSRIPIYSRTPDTRSEYIGPSDLADRAEGIRYTKVQETMAKTLGKLPFVKNEDAHAKTIAFMTKLQDNMLPVGQMYDKLRDKYGPGVITQDLDAYFQETLMHGVSGPKKEKFDRTSFKPVLEQIANMKVTDQEDGTLGRISGYYKDMVEKYENRSHALANAYLYALHAGERNARMKAISKGEREGGSGMSDSEADSIKAFVAMLPASKRETLEQIDRRVQDMIKQTNQVYIEGGLIPDYLLNEDIADDIKQKFKQYNSYVPLRGFSDPEADLDTTNETYLSSTQKYGASGKPNLSALGRSTYAGDILANVAVQHHQAIDKAERNKVGQSLLRLLEREDIDTDEFGRVLEQHPMKRVLVNGTIRYVPDRNFNDLDDPILTVRRDGKEFLIAMNPAIAKAMKGSLSAKQGNIAVRFAHQITRTYANLLTSYNPAFLLSNWPRDIATALFNAQQYNMKGAEGKIMKGVVPAFRSILNVINEKGTADPYWANRYKQFYENGGQNVLNQMAETVNASKDIQRTIKEIVEADNKGMKNVVKRGFVGPAKSLLGYVEALNTAVENSTRLSFFDAMATQLESEGVPQKEALKRAAFAARNLTTNFSKGGEWKNGLNAFYLFFNASLQGSMAIFNSLANSKKARKVAGAVVVLGFLLDQLNAALSADDDEDGIKDFDNISDYTLSHNLILPDLNGDGTYVKIPMAYGINTMFDLGRVTSNLIRGTAGYEGTYTPEQAATQLLRVTEEMINPFGGNSFLTFISPTLGDLPVELLTNEDFRNAPIYKELSPFEQYRSRSGLYWSTTSPSAIGISKFINDTIGGGDDFIPGSVMGMRVDIQPDVIEHVLGFMTGGVGTLARQTADTLTSNVPNAAMGQWESDMIRTTPFVNKFLTAVTDKDRAGDYYEKRNDVFAVRRSYRSAVEARDAQQIAVLRQRYPEILRIMEPVRKIDNAITKLRTRLKLIKVNPNIPRKRRLEFEEKIEDRIFQLQQRAMQLMSVI